MVDSLSNAALAQQISTLVAAWNAREAEFRNWVGGTATGGSNSDGKYPLSDFLGNSSLVSCPAALASSVSGPAVAAANSAAAALASANTAGNSATAATTSATNAGTALTATQVARDLAITAKSNAQTYAANAQAYATSAQTSATAASSSQASASSSASAAASSASSASSSATSAASSAAAAATFNPALYLLKTGGTLSGPINVIAYPAAQDADFMSLRPADYSVGKPGLFFRLNGTAWRLSLWDGASNAGTLNIKATGGVLANGNPVWHTGNFNPTSYLPLSGGTVTGALTVNGGVTVPGTGINGFFSGTGDGASFTTYNTALKVWWGLGMMAYDGTINGYYDARAGTWNVKGGYQVNGNTVWHSGNLSPITWASDITWNTGVNVKVPGESSFDLYTGSQWSVWDGGVGTSAIFVPYGGQVQIGIAGSRGLGVVGNLGVSGAASFTGSITVSSNNVTGGGIVLSDDGDIVDLNNGFCSLRFSAGVAIYSANKGGSSVITLGSNGQINASSAIYASGGRRVPERLDGRGSAGITFSTSGPSGGSDGDIWFVYS